MSHQKYEGDINKELRRKATVMNMATVRNLVVTSDKSFVRNIPYLNCKGKIIEQMTELHHLAHGVSRTNNDYLPHKLRVFKICVIEFKACFVKNNIETN